MKAVCEQVGRRDVGVSSCAVAMLQDGEKIRVQRDGSLEEESHLLRADPGKSHEIRWR